MGNFFLVFLPAILVLLSSLIDFCLQLWQMKKLRKDFEGKQVIVNDTYDLRKALSRDLEGTWRLYGKFLKFQKNDINHFSRGYLILDWNVTQNYYDAIYCYSILKEYETECIITCVCKGVSVNSNKKDEIRLQFDIEDRVSKDSFTNFRRNFSLVLKLNKDKTLQEIKYMSCKYETPDTEGELNFTKVY